MGKKKATRTVTAETADASEEIFENDDFDIGKARIEVQRVPSETEGKTWDFYWMFFAANGVPIATGVTPNHRLNDMKKTLDALPKQFAEAKLVRLYG